MPAPPPALLEVLFGQWIVRTHGFHLVERVLSESSAWVVAAGGVGSLEHVRAVLSIGHPRLEGVVVGRALYEGKVDLREALSLSAEL